MVPTRGRELDDHPLPFIHVGIDMAVPDLSKAPPMNKILNSFQHFLRIGLSLNKNPMGAASSGRLHACSVL
jgi:hypothetical protein